MQLAGRRLYDNKGMMEMDTAISTAINREKRGRRGGTGKKRGKAGETLTETLVAMLIIGLSSVLFLTMVGAAGRISRNAEKAYKELYGIISAADNKKDAGKVPDTTVIGEITVEGVSSVEVDVDWYGSTDYVLSYKVK